MDDGRAMLEQKAEHEAERLPMVLEAPDTCCVRSCDQSADVVLCVPLDPGPGQRFTLWAYCKGHLGAP